MAFSILLQAQSQDLSILNRAEISDVIIEGKIVAQNSFWDNENKSIFTENRIEVFKSFKGEDKDTISLVSKGGTVGDQFQIVSHAIEFSLYEEGVFFCKAYKIPQISNSEILMLNSINGFVKYHYNSKEFKAADRFSVYENIKTELYEPISFHTSADFISKKKNGFEKKIEAWLEETLTIISSTDILIEFTFDNINLIGTDEVEFDIMAKSNEENIKFAASDIYISYSTDAFGNSVVTNDKIEATKETVIENDVYTLELTDEAADIVKFLVNAGLEPNQLYPLAQIAEKFLHIRLDVENVYELASLSFDNVLMTNQSFFYDVLTGEFIGFDRVSVENPVFPFLVPSISNFSPNPITAGTSSELTITGTNFGATKGKVRFPNGDDGGMSLMEADDADVTWSDTEIIVKVPSVRAGVGQKSNPASSGIFQIQTAPSATFPNGEITENNPPLLPLDIRYAVANFRPIPARVRPHMAELNDTGGYSFSLGSSLTIDAISIVEQALCDWNASTGVNWSLGATLVANPEQDENDGVNTIFLGDESNFTGSTSGATAFTTITGQLCSDGSATYISDVDIVLRADLSNISSLFSWHFDEVTNPGFFDFDFYSVIKHELGHAHNLKHATPDNKLMFWQLVTGDTRRDFHPEDVNGGNDVLDATLIALTQGFCPVDPMMRNNSPCLNSTTDADYSNKITVSPNPLLSSKIQLVFDFRLNGNVDFELIDVNGKPIFQQSKFLDDNNQVELVFPQKLSSGMYYLLISDNEGNQFVKKITKI